MCEWEVALKQYVRVHTFFEDYFAVRNVNLA